ncbi:hypothetical protein ANN_06000 [Periplaneta americana]|uniref:Ion transport domain-containing protein n=1 Tax=Periplaneta americana TaxID=6978 RepID=A0ABQ8TCC3_PERAM|nr:hypothetical protein ANN_06000 [Periplaneta americana]
MQLFKATKSIAQERNSIFSELSKRNIFFRCLQHGASANATCGAVNTSACHLAALKGSSEVLGILLNYGASPRVFDTEGRSPLHLAAWTGDAATMRVLLDKAGDMINTGPRFAPRRNQCKKIHSTRELPHTEPGSTPLHVACQRVHLECIQMLLAAGANKDALDDCGMSCFDVIGEKLVGDENHLPASKRFVGMLNSGSGPEGNALINSFFRRLPEVIRVLLKAGAMPSSTVTTPRTTCMHTAVALECPEAVKELEALSRHGQYVDRSGCTPMHLAVSLRLQEPLKALLHCYIDRDSEADSSASRSNSAEANPVDERDSSGNTSLHYAISTQWFAGVEIFLEAGADVCEKNSDGATSLHLAAQSGNLDILEEILNISDSRRILNSRDNRGESPLFQAVSSGNMPCVKRLLEAGADFTCTLDGNMTVLHRAAEGNHPEVLEELLRYNLSNKDSFINTKTDPGGLTPLHIASIFGYLACVNILLSFGCDITLKTSVLSQNESTALHLASSHGHSGVVESLLDHNSDRKIVEARDIHGCTPLHLACQQGRRDCARLLLKKGADMSARMTDTNGRKFTAVDFLISATTQPVELLEEVLDSSIFVNEFSINDPKCVVSVDYRVLLPRDGYTREMQVLNALFDTGTKSGQERLLMHPLVESFLTLKWKKLKSWFYIIIAMYTVFLISFTTLVMILYYYNQSQIQLPARLDFKVWRIVTLASMGLFFFQVVVITEDVQNVHLLLEYRPHIDVSLTCEHDPKRQEYCVCPQNMPQFDSERIPNRAPETNKPMILNGPTSRNREGSDQEVVHAIQSPKLYLADWESWLKWICFALSAIVATVDHDVNGITWPRHVTTAAILLVWTEYMFLLCRDPDWGYCVLMFTKVAINVFKVISIFAFLIIGFAFAFMVEFQTVSPFSSPFDSFVKTVVMMTNELDYSGIFDNGKLSSPVYARIIFLCFVFLVSIVLMNLLVGIAVADITNLEAQGKTNRLRKQVDFASTMERILYYGGLLRCLHSSLKNKKGPLLEIYPGRPRRKKYKGLPRALTDTLIKHAFEHKKSEIQYTMQDLFNKMDAISKAPEFSSPTSNTIDVDDIVKKLNELILEISQQLKDKKFDDATAFLDLKSGTSLFREDVSGRIDRLQLDMRGMLTVMKKVLNYVSPQGHVVDIGQHNLLRNTPKLSSC